MMIEMSERKDGTWQVVIDDILQLGGFEDQREAAVWVLEYQTKILSLAQSATKKKDARAEQREERRKVLGAILLEADRVQ